ncbi:MAG: FKBP-type peptidyl-prolyl cis-trans isomerase, partial [Ignavibacteriota bacterium]
MKFTNLFLASLFVLSISSCNNSSPKGEGPSTVPPIATPGSAATPEVVQPEVVHLNPKHAPGKYGDTTVTATGLMYIDSKVGKGPSPKSGQKITVNYTGKLPNGTIFDSNVDPSKGHVQ